MDLISKISSKILPIFSLPLITGFLLLVFGRYEPGREDLGIYLTNISKELETSMNVELIHTLKDSFEHSIILLTPKSLLGGSYLITVYYCFILYLVFLPIHLIFFDNHLLLDNYNKVDEYNLQFECQ